MAYEKKIIYRIILAVIIIVAGIGIYAYNDQQQKQNILDSIQVTFVEDPTIEYGEKDFDLSKLIKEKTDDVIIPNALDTTTLGKQTLVYKVEKDGLTKEFTLDAEVKDTKGAEIIFKEDAVSLEYGAEFDVKGNIETVKDPVDGDVPYAETAGENNYYIIEGSVDTVTAGEYTVSIKAKDKNGIESEKTFTVIVDEEYVEPQAQTTNGGGYTRPTYQQPSSGGGYTAPSNGGGNSSSGGGSTPAPAPTCDMTPQGMSYEGATILADSMQLDGTAPEFAPGASAYIVGPIINSCDDVLGYQIRWKGIDY